MAATTSSKIRIWRCWSCRHALLDAFAAFAKVSKPVNTARFANRVDVCSQIPRRSLATIGHCRSDLIQQQDDGDPKVERASREALEQPLADLEAPKPTSELPWYLQVKTPQPFMSPLLDRQRLPDLPPDPPPLLQPMLEHISTQLGLDDLSLLDLRNLDPPPALGSNLLMVLGTARSDKHLHVSADRFCRWLRTEHKLSPFADGLLGRGELKLKLKRKVKRARVLSRVRSMETDNVDDGLRTGWVCVNVGNVADGKPIAQSESSIDGYVGFGTRTEGVKIVIQMLTGEKREELDLERLWRQALARQDRRQQRILKGEQEVVEARGAEVGAVPIAKDPVFEKFQSSSHSEKPSNPMFQTRPFHSIARIYSTNESGQIMADNDVLNAAHLEARALALSEQNLESSPTAPPSALSSEGQQDSRDSYDAMRLLSLQTKLKYLKALP